MEKDRLMEHISCKNCGRGLQLTSVHNAGMFQPTGRSHYARSFAINTVGQLVFSVLVGFIMAIIGAVAAALYTGAGG